MIKKKEETTTLYTRGIFVSNKKFLEKSFRKYNYKTIGEFLNSILEEAKKQEKKK